MARRSPAVKQARRQRVIDAAMALGLEGGYEAVQMRDVAARADVAMGTVYRYFTSKDHLLAATLVHWVEMLDTRMVQHPPPRTPRRPGARRPRQSTAGHGTPAQARRRRLRLALLSRPRRGRLPSNRSRC